MVHGHNNHRANHNIKLGKLNFKKITFALQKNPMLTDASSKINT